MEGVINVGGKGWPVCFFKICECARGKWRGRGSQMNGDDDWDMVR